MTLADSSELATGGFHGTFNFWRPFAIIVAREVRYSSDQRPGGSMDVKLETERLVLRPLRPDDAPTIARLAGRREIADTTLSIPHPYSERSGMKREGLLRQRVRKWGVFEDVVLMAILRDDWRKLEKMSSVSGF